MTKRSCSDLDVAVGAAAGGCAAAAESVEAQPEPGESGEMKLAKWEERLWGEGLLVVAGTDEAGRGPLAGPVTAAAYAVLDHSCAELRKLLLEVAADSKQCTEEERDTAYAKLTDEKWRNKAAWAVAEVSAARIDETNILRASLAAMSEAVQKMEPRPDCVLVDGCNRPPELLRAGEQWTRGSRAEEMARADTKQQRLGAFFAKKPVAARPVDAPWRPGRVESVINGDAQVLSISAASIIAKVHRDRIMAELHEKYPVYGFAEHKGYGTATHREAIKTHGPCPEHRKSFGPICDAVNEVDSSSSAGSLLAALGASTSSESLSMEVQHTPEKPALTPRAAVSQPSKAEPPKNTGVPTAKRGRKGSAATNSVETPVKNASPAVSVSEASTGGVGVKRGRKPKAKKDAVDPSLIAAGA